jgi:hypothetical protein
MMDAGFNIGYCMEHGTYYTSTCQKCDAEKTTKIMANAWDKASKEFVTAVTAATEAIKELTKALECIKEKK